MIIIAMFWVLGWGPRSRAYHAPTRSHPPPTPFLQNTVKDSPERGWGTHIDRQPYCHTLLVPCVCFFPLLEGGNAARFFHFVFLVSGPVSFAVFCRSSRLRVVFEKNFGSELLFSGLGVGLVFFGGFLPMFLLHFWRFAPESVRRKFSYCQV